MRRREFITLAGSAALSLGRDSAAAEALHLYAIAGSPQHTMAINFPAVFLSLGPQSREVQWAATLASPAAGWDFLLFSADAGLAVLGGPVVAVDNIVVIRFDAPSDLKTAKFAMDDFGIVGRHLVWIEGQANLALRLSNFPKSQERKYVAWSLAEMRYREVAPSVLYRDFAIDGTPGIAVDNTDSASMARDPQTGGWTVNLSSPPTPFRGASQNLSNLPADDASLIGANKHMQVFTWGKALSRTGPEATTPLRVLPSGQEAWRDIHVPGGGSGVRLFGEYFTVNIRQILADRNRRVLSASSELDRRTGPSFVSECEGLGIKSPGKVYLHHVPSRRTITHDTGEPDTEVLWVEKERVLFRCARKLYDARIDGTRLTEHRELLERDFIADVHWVFYGPPSDAPPNPPWEPFALS